MSRIRMWLGFEDEGHDGGLPAEYNDCIEQDEMSPESEKQHAEYVRRVAEEHEFALSDWVPTIPSRARS
jgi:hypothetical protein